MPYDLGLSAADRIAYFAALKDSHDIRVLLEIRDRDEALIDEVSDSVNLIGGEIQVTADQDVSRSLSLQLFDPDHRLQFDGSNPATGAVYADNFIAVKYGVYVKKIAKWIDVPVFWGPITKFSRDGAQVTIEAQGKEALALDPHLVTAGYTLKKGMTVEDAIRKVMDRVGETKYSLGMLVGKLHKSRTVVPGEAPWLVCIGGSEEELPDPSSAAKKKTRRRIMRFRRRHYDPGDSLVGKANGYWYLFFNGRGVLAAKQRNANSSWVFDKDQLVSRPGFTYDVLSFRNHAEVRGGVPRKAKHHVRGEYTLPNPHPLSPYSLRRNGVGRKLSIFHESDSLKTTAACRDRAQKLVEAVAYEGVEAQFTCLPIPHLEEYDIVTLKFDGYNIAFPLTQFTIPLVADSTMSIGFNKRVRRPK